MLVLDVKRICASRGITQVYAHLARHGFTHHTASKIAAGDARTLHLNHLLKLCELLRCTPNDLFRWRPDAGQEAAPDHPLAGMQDTGNTSAHFKKLLDLPLAEQQAVLARLTRPDADPPAASA